MPLDTTDNVPLAIGDPGRAATELPAGRPTALLAGADHEISECSLGGVEVRAASLRGLMHRFREEPRQDRFALAFDESSNTLLVAVCDGVGSKACSHEAAEFVSKNVLRSYMTSQDWATAVTEVNGALARLVEEKSGQIAPGVDPESLAMATTFVGIAIRIDVSPVTASIVWTDDSVVWILKEGVWAKLTGDDGQSEPSVHTGRVRALPHPEPSYRVLETTIDGDSRIFVMTDGIGVPLEQSSEVQDTLARWWIEPPDLFSFARQVGFARKSHLDDRTAVGIWFPPTADSETEFSGSLAQDSEDQK